MKLLNTLETQLKREQNFITDNGEIKKWVVINYAQNHNERLIELLIENETLKEKFFKKIKGHLLFDYKLFVTFMENKNYFNDSYTYYKNKVGLQIGNKYLKQLNDVSLVWPFKDCVLEGGQTKEEQKREEIFFNEILAQDEINQLFEPKILNNWKRYTVDGEKKVLEIKRDEEGTIQENMIIKGNNLLALHSLLPQFAGKIKLIYIDPPYNTENDSFRYNDSFNHSSWLTFMKNRLEVARSLLSDDGFMLCHIDNNEGEYLKLLLDDIYGRDNHINTFYIRVRYPSKTLKQDMDFHKEIETVYVYKKSNKAKPYLDKKETNIDKYVFYFKELAKGKEIVLGGKKAIIFNKNEIEIVKDKSSINGRKEIWATGSILDGNSSGRFFRDYLAGRYEEDGYGVIYKIFGVGDEIDGYRYFTGPQKEGATKGKYFQGIPKKQSENDDKTIDIPINNFYDLAGSFGNCRLEGGVELRSGKKPEELLKIIIHHFSTKNDIILDFFSGSGTTGAVAHKMNRQYILIEQLDYIHELPEARLKNVIGKKVKNGDEMFDNLEFDKTGISDSVNWQGGGDFLYLELKRHNEAFIEQIQKAKSTKALISIWGHMKEKSFIDYNLDIKLQDDAMNEFKTLTLKQQKEHLFEILDKNQMYVNLSSLDDKDFLVSEEDKKLTKEFFKK